jgi:hypothetical protein
MAGRTSAATAATDTWTDPDGYRTPAGEVHAWLPRTNQTLCGVPLARAGLARFAGVPFEEAQPATGNAADRVTSVCRRCLAATGHRRDEKPWRRTNPRP